MIAPHGRWTSSRGGPTDRVQLVDVLRGIAVVLMLGWHCSDGWLAEAHRAGLGWSIARVTGGIAAPLFLFAAGMSVALGARRGRNVGRAIARGLELLVLGHALRLITWAIDHYAIASLGAWPGLVFGGGFVTLALFALRRSARALAPLTGLLAGAHLAAVVAHGPALTSIVLRFDILHCIGVSVIACALLMAAAERWRRHPAWEPSAVMLVVAVGLVGSSALFIEALEGTAGGLAWLARGPALRRIAPFPLLPWCGYALLGCAVARAPIAWTKCGTAHLLCVFVAALALAAATFEGGTSFTRRLLAALPSVRPLARLAFSAGVALALGSALQLARGRGAAVLATLGRVSLPVYALHLQVAYGTLARPLRHALTPAACALLVALLVTASIFGGLWIERRRVAAKRGRAFAAALGSTANSRA